MDGDGAARATKDVYSRVTDQIISALETGEGTCNLPWRRQSALPRSVASGRPYRGINAIALWSAATERDFTSPLWGTFQQWKLRRTAVRRGERATIIVVWKPLARPAALEPATAEAPPTLARAFAVFNAQQTDGAPLDAAPPIGDLDRDAAAEAFFRALPLAVRHGGDSAFYDAAADVIHLPPYQSFHSSQDYYAVRAHESVHAAGAVQRLERDLKGRFGSQAYAMEELIAELGAAFLCAELGLSAAPRPDHAAYVRSWLSVLKHDRRAVFTAAAKAQAAADWLLSFSRPVDASPADGAAPQYLTEQP